MMKSPDVHSELISECLFGETIEVIKKKRIMSFKINYR